MHAKQARYQLSPSPSLSITSVTVIFLSSRDSTSAMHLGSAGYLGCPVHFLWRTSRDDSVLSYGRIKPHRASRMRLNSSSEMLPLATHDLISVGMRGIPTCQRGVTLWNQVSQLKYPQSCSCLWDSVSDRAYHLFVLCH